MRRAWTRYTVCSPVTTWGYVAGGSIAMPTYRPLLCTLLVKRKRAINTCCVSTNLQPPRDQMSAVSICAIGNVHTISFSSLNSN